VPHMTEWTDHELETARLRIRDGAQREQSSLFASPVPLSSLSEDDRTKHLTLSRELAIDLEATTTLEIWKHRVIELEAPERWAETLKAVHDA
jgi:hypothetical protein